MITQEEHSGSGGHRENSESYLRHFILKSREGCIYGDVNIFRRRVMKRAL